MQQRNLFDFDMLHRALNKARNLLKPAENDANKEVITILGKVKNRLKTLEEGTGAIYSALVNLVAQLADYSALRIIDSKRTPQQA